MEAIKPKLLLWDDFESTFHPYLLRRIIEWLGKQVEQQRMQVVLSTHSIDVISTILDVKPTDARFIILSKDEEDILHYDVKDVYDMEVIVGASHDPSGIQNLRYPAKTHRN